MIEGISPDADTLNELSIRKPYVRTNSDYRR